MNSNQTYKCDDCHQLHNRKEMHFDDSGDYCKTCYMIWFREAAVAAGIPADVVMGTKKLTDFFTPEYIAFKCNKH